MASFSSSSVVMVTSGTCNIPVVSADSALSLESEQPVRQIVMIPRTPESLDKSENHMESKPSHKYKDGFSSEYLRKNGYFCKDESLNESKKIMECRPIMGGLPED